MESLGNVLGCIPQKFIDAEAVGNGLLELRQAGQ